MGDSSAGGLGDLANQFGEVMSDTQALGQMSQIGVALDGMKMSGGGGGVPSASQLLPAVVTSSAGTALSKPASELATVLAAFWALPSTPQWSLTTVGSQRRWPACGLWLIMKSIVKQPRLHL